MFSIKRRRLNNLFDQAANRFKAAEMPSSTAETASVPAAIAEEEEEGEEVDFKILTICFDIFFFSG